MINPRLSADWSTTKPIAAFSCTPRVQKVHTKAEFVQFTPALLGLVVLCSYHALNVLRNISLTIESLQIEVRPSRLEHSLVHHVYKKYKLKLRSYTLPLVSADWSTNKPIAAFSCTPRVQEVHTKA